MQEVKFIIEVLIASIILILLDWYFFRAIKGVFTNRKNDSKKKIMYAYRIQTILCISIVILATSHVYIWLGYPRWLRMYLSAFWLILVLAKLAGSIPLLLKDVLYIFRKTVRLFRKQSAVIRAPDLPSISRSQFIYRMALAFAAIPIIGLVSAMLEAFNFKLYKVKVILPNLPAAFNGLRIVQISDLHTGSFASIIPIQKAVDMVMKQKADIIFFTGDLINSHTREAIPFMETLSRIKAPMGVCSTLGNHDYEQFHKWKNLGDREKNMQAIINAHQQLGWTLMMNEHIVLEKKGSQIALIGVENWGFRERDPKFADLKKACAGTENFPVRILLSHDPSHWDEKVTTEHKNIDLTLSGHTHGFQCGVEVGNFQWSPGEYIYKHWAGLYAQDNQQLYVNRGIGFLSFPGRLGILPEITVMELYNA